MRDLLDKLQIINENKVLNEEPPRGRQDGPGTRQGTNPAANAAIKKANQAKTQGGPAYKSFGDMISAIKLPGRQGVADPNQSRANIQKAQAAQAKPAAPKPAPKPKINPNVPAGGPRRANPVNPQQAALARAAKAVANPAPMPADQASARGTQAIAKAPAPAAPPSRPAAPRAKVKATAANTKDFDKTMALQKKLQAQGFDIKADGIMGPNTRKAMAAAQAKSQANRASSQGGRTAAQAASAPQAPAPAPTQVAKAPDDGTRGSRGRNAPRNRRAEPTQTAQAGSEKPGLLSRIGAGIKDFFSGGDRKPSPGRGRGQKPPTAVAQAPDAAKPIPVGGRRAPKPAAGPNAPGSNFATAADGSISRTDTARQPGEPLPRGSRRNRRTAPAAAPTQSARRGDDQQPAATTRTASVSPERGTIPGQGPATRVVTRGGRQVTGAEADAATAKLQQARNLARAQRMFGPGKTPAEYNELIKQRNQQNARQLAALDKAGRLPDVNIDDL